MKTLLLPCFMLILISATSINAQESSKYLKNWPQWRGPLVTGEAPHGNPPLEWSEDKNVKWKIEVPGKGHSTPIVWENMLFITTAVETDEKIEAKEAANSGGRMRGLSAESVLDFKVMCIHKGSGKVLWETSVTKEAPMDATHNTGSWASNSAVTDGEKLYAYFGSRGLYCLDFEGNILWERDFGQMSKKMSFGEGSSPAIYGNKIVVLWDHEGDSFLYILNKNTGKDIMKIPRDERTTWSSPLIAEVNGKAQVITHGTTQIRSYDLETGDIIWTGTGMTANVIPHPMVQDGWLYLMSGFRGNASKVIDLNRAMGNTDGTEAVVWEYNKNCPYTPSPALVGNKLYFLRTNNGNLTCIDAKDGTEYYALERLEGTGTIFASPVAAKDRIYITSQSGISYVIKQGDNFEILARNVLEDGNFASPAIVGNDMFIRTFQYLYCLSEE